MTSWFACEESGQGLTEYALIMALVSIALVTGLTGMRGALEGIFQSTSDVLVKIANGIQP